MQKIDVIRLILWFSLMNHKGSLYITHAFLAYAANISTLARLEFLRLSLPPLRFLIFGKRYKVTVCHDRLSLTLGQSDYFTQMVLSLRPLEVNCTIYKCAFGKKKSQFLTTVLSMFLNVFPLSCIIPKHNLSNLYL